MTKPAIAASLFLTTALASAAPVPKEWEHRYDGVLRAIRTKDFEGFKSYFADDFRAVAPNGKEESRAEFFKGIESMYASVDKVTTHLKLKNVHAMHGMNHVRFDFHLSLHHGKKGVTRIHEVGTDTWKRIDGKWMLVRTVDKTLTVR